MKITELKRKLDEKKRKTSSPSNVVADSCSWNPMGEEAPFEVQLALIKEDSDLDSSYEPDEDDEQNFKEALSLLDTARDLLLASAQFLDARNLTLPGDQDWAVTVTCADIRQFLQAFDYKKELISPPRKMTACYPAKMKGIVSHECIHTLHNKCPLVNCDCPCHAHELVEDSAKRAAVNYKPAQEVEVIREHISHQDDKLDQGFAPI